MLLVLITTWRHRQETVTCIHILKPLRVIGVLHLTLTKMECIHFIHSMPCFGRTGKKAGGQGVLGEGKGIVLNKTVVKDLTEKVLLEGSE